MAALMSSLEYLKINFNFINAIKMYIIKIKKVSKVFIQMKTLK